uniref:Capsid protein n=1 Tax=Cruciviridae sp. TaxID=1955495 RepID=A0A1S6LVH0_9VIRU|nr:capsid protein [Cruciviridae sp.]
MPSSRYSLAARKRRKVAPRRAPARRIKRRRAPYRSSRGGWMSSIGRGIGHVAGSLAGGVARGIGYNYGIGKSVLPSSVTDIASSAYNYGSRILGMGDYKLARNSLMTSKGQVPFMHSSKDGVRVRHREFLQDVSSSVTFVNTVYDVNPGLSSCFPWLSALAQNFEEYRLEGMVFEFKSTAANLVSGTNNALGTVIMAADYNSAAPNFVNKAQMENAMWSNSTSTIEGMCMPIECAPSLNPLSNMYIRTGAVPSGQDQRMYDLCNLQIATVGSQAAAVIGELWVTYDVVLLKPVLDSGLALASQSSHFSLTAPAVTTAYFGTSRVNLYDSIGILLSGTVLTFPLGSNGTYQIVYAAYGASTSVSAPTHTLVNCTNVADTFDNASLTVLNNSGATDTKYCEVFYVNISDPTLQATVTYSVGTLCGTPTYGDLYIQQVNDNIRLNVFA